MKTSSEIMKNILITLSLVALSCSIATAQWMKVYQTDSASGNREHLAGMGFWGNDSGVVCSEGNNVKNGVTAVTLDGGLSWDTTPIDPSVTEDIYPPPLLGSNSSFLDVNHIWFCNGAAVCHTNNGGKTWMVDSNRDSLALAINSIYFVDSLIGFEGGESLMMYRTSDGGKNWSIVHSESDGYGYNVYQIKFCNPKLGIAICGDLVGLILRTTDSGMTWALTTDINHVGFGAAVSLSYPDPHNAWFADGPFLWHSTDSGLTWNHVGAQNPLGGYFRSISFIDSLHGIATASSGRLLIIGYTSDGGQSWQTTSINSEANDGNAGFTSLIDTNTAYAGGFDAVFKFNIANLGVQSTNPIPTSARLENEDGNFFIVMPQASGGRVRIVDALGRVLWDEILSPGGHTELPNASPSQPQFRFAEVECNGQMQVFKVLN